ncbi:hypothetical protein P7C70_g3792, partial [Phenoliferia sp. Uapishka_3]
MASPAFVSWNRETEAKLALLYDPPYQTVVRGPMMDAHTSPSSSSELEQDTKEMRDVLDKARLFQVGISTRLIEDAATNHSRKVWLALEPKEQRNAMEEVLEFVLTGDKLQMRQDLPEIRMMKLLERGGRGFFDLAERCAVPGGDKHEISWLENKRYDQYLGTMACVNKDFLSPAPADWPF